MEGSGPLKDATCMQTLFGVPRNAGAVPPFQLLSSLASRSLGLIFRTLNILPIKQLSAFQFPQLTGREALAVQGSELFLNRPSRSARLQNHSAYSALDMEPWNHIYTPSFFFCCPSCPCLLPA